MRTLRLGLTLIGWACLYAVLGYISLILDDPYTRVAFVWFPAGVAVAAFLFSAKRHWPVLFCALFIARMLLDVGMLHNLQTSFVLSAISLGSDFAVAYCTRRFSRRGDDLNIILVWLLASLIISALAALVGVGWLSVSNHISLSHFWVWWAANVSGIIAVNIMLAGWMVNQGSMTRLSRPMQLGIGVLLLAATLLATWHIFSQSLSLADNTALIFLRTVLPIVLILLLTIIVGSRAGSLTFLFLAALVVFYSWQGLGPFFLSGLNSNESLLLAQCYLCTIALLLVFVRILTRNIKSVSPESAFSQRYHMAMLTGTLTWDNPALFGAVLLPDSRQGLLDAVAPDEVNGLLAYWQQAIDDGASRHGYTFHLTLAEGKNFIISQQELIRVDSEQGFALIGRWNVMHGNSPAK